MFNQFKKIIIFITLLFTNTINAQLNIFTCEPEWAALVRTLGGQAINVYSATTNQQDPHYIQARPSLISKVRRADLLVCTGAELEIGWLPLLIRKSGNNNIQPNQLGHFLASDHITLLEKPKKIDRSLGDIHTDGNPHFHLDPHRILFIAKALTTRLKKLDQKNQNLYDENFSNFSKKWKLAISNWEERAKPLRNTKIVVSHNSWVYLENWLGLTKVATLEPSPGILPSSHYLSQLLIQLKKKPAQLILYADFKNDKSAKWLSQKTGIRTISLPFSVAPKEDLFQWFDRLLNDLLRAKHELGKS